MVTEGEKAQKSTCTGIRAMTVKNMRKSLSILPYVFKGLFFKNLSTYAAPHFMLRTRPAIPSGNGAGEWNHGMHIKKTGR